ncbi:hypothetical protein IT575_03605 [bacterium]|nr:hypothetical protein [bacterium]
MSRLLALPAVLLCLALLGLAACGTGEKLDTAPAAPADGFGLQLLPESYIAGGSVEAIELQQSSEGSTVQLELQARDASALKALFASVSYDPARYSPAGARINEALAPQSQSLQLVLTGQPGKVELGAMLTRPQERSGAGFNGDGVLATIFFERRPFSAARGVSAVPTSDAARSGLTYIGTDNFLWNLYNPGDYDQNGVVAVQDLTPIGINFGDSVPAGGGPDGRDFKSVLDVIDGSDDGVINVQDLTAIGVNFGNKIVSFTLFQSASAADYPASNSGPNGGGASAAAGISLTFSSTDISQFRREYNYLHPAALAGPFFWVRPEDGEGNYGTPSALLDISGGSGSTISGTVLADTSVPKDGIGDVPLAGVTVTAGASSAVSGGDGKYFIVAVPDGTYDLTPSLAGYSFLPAAVPVTVPPAAAQDFVALPAAANTDPQISSIDAVNAPSLPGRTVQLYANATDADGDSLSYQWSVVSGSGVMLFGGISSLNGNAYLPAPGIEETAQVQVLVTDGHGGSATLSRDVQFTNGAFIGSWHPVIVRDGGGNNTGVRSVLLDVDGAPDIFYYNQDPTDGDGVFHAVPTDWLGQFWNDFGKYAEGGFSGLSAVYDGSASNLIVSVCDDTGMAPAPLTSYLSTIGGGLPTAFSVDNAIGTGVNVSSILDLNGQPLLAYHNSLGLATGSLRVCGANDYVNLNWKPVQPVEGEPEAPGVNVGSFTSIAQIGGFPAVAYYDEANGELRYVRASDLSGTVWNSPTPVVAHAAAGDTVGYSPQLVYVEGRPAVFFLDITNNSVLYKRADDNQGNAWTGLAWAMTLGGANSFSSISGTVFANGQPAVAYASSDGSLNLATITTPDGSTGDYSTIEVPVVGKTYINPSLAEVGGHHAVSYYESSGQDLMFSMRY